MKQFSRHEFFDLVWSKPMTQLAKEFGLSDVALHKTCKRHRIPTPGLGYWAKVAAGKSVKRASFRDISDNSLNTVCIYPSHISSLPPEVKKVRDAELAKAKETKQKLDEAIPTRELHPCVERLKRKLETTQMQKCECAIVNDPKLFSVSISPANTARLIGILDALARQAESKGYKIESGEKALQFNVEEDGISVQVFEKRDKIPHVRTEKEQLQMEKWDEECARKRKLNQYIWEYERPKVPDWDHSLNGLLAIEIDKSLYHGDGIRRKFSDTKHQKLEDMIPDILVTVATCAAAIKARRLERERREIERAEEARLAEINRQKQRLEDKRVKSLEKYMSSWQKAADIRNFADAVEARMQSAKQDFPEVKEWLTWARSYADKIDILTDGLPILAQKKDLNYWD